MFTLKYLCIIYVLVVIVDKSLCVCRQSHMTICDSLEDLQNATNRDTWTELLVGSEQSTPSLSKNLMHIRFYLFNKLTTMTIFRQLKGVTTQYGLQCSFETSRLKVLKFYENDLQTLKSYTFPKIAYRHLGLVNNNIKIIESNTFFAFSIDSLDLSDNHLEVIESDNFNSMRYLRIITINNNKLTHIEPNSFPLMLEILNLENNNLRHLQSELLSKLTKLKEISLKNNKFTVLPEGVKFLTQLQSLDFSYNKIAQIDDNIFGQLLGLLLIDLSNNLLRDDKILRSVLVPERNASVEISLAFNRMAAMKLENMTLGKHVLYLYGNPWDCLAWYSIEKLVGKNQNSCDKKFFDSGTTPYCLNYRELGHNFALENDIDVERFHNVIKSNEKLIACTPDKSLILYPVAWGCVA